MATSQIEVESRVTELATQAFKAFCEEISGTFGVDTECQQQAVAAETVAGLQKRFNKLVAVNIVESEGLLGETFQFIFDQEGLFTLGGIIIMSPEERIMSNKQLKKKPRRTLKICKLPLKKPIPKSLIKSLI